ncbi:hypothetical protein [Pyrococcus kukulkanii]|uniref:Uncharacterized protein n=1 Tax=Pyrococcus kukulkanii TaxID=1609559 RepID=A0ABV4T6C0_9EURY
MLETVVKDLCRLFYEQENTIKNKKDLLELLENPHIMRLPIQYTNEFDIVRGRMKLDTLTVEYITINNTLARLLPIKVLPTHQWNASKIYKIIGEMSQEYIAHKIVFRDDIAKALEFPEELDFGYTNNKKEFFVRYFKWFSKLQENLFREYRRYIDNYKQYLREKNLIDFIEDPRRHSEEELQYFLEESGLSPVEVIDELRAERLDDGVMIYVKDFVTSNYYYMYLYKDSLGNFVVLVVDWMARWDAEKYLGGLEVKRVKDNYDIYVYENIRDTLVEVPEILGMTFRITGDYTGLMYTANKYYMEVHSRAKIELINGSKYELREGVYSIRVPGGIMNTLLI